jgi:hypothetical protein
MNNYILTLSNYIKSKGYEILHGIPARKKFRKSVDSRGKNIFETICGQTIFETLEDFVDDDDSIIYLLVNTKTAVATSIFVGYIEKDNKGELYLESSYTCSHLIPKGGVLLRYYALLQQNQLNDRVTRLHGSISGGIPPIEDGDDDSTILQKTARLKKYHEKNGATIDGSKFTYNIDEVIRSVDENFSDKALARGKRQVYKGKKSARKYRRKQSKSKRTIKKRK